MTKNSSPGKQRGASARPSALARENSKLRAQLTEARHESEERLRQMGNNLPDSAVYQYCYETDGTPRFLYISSGIERLNGVSVEEVLRDAGTLLGQFPPDYLEQVVEAEKRSARELTDFDMEVPMRLPDGQVRWMRLHSRPHRMPDGRVIWDGVQTDITARKRAEEALRQSEEKFRAFFNTVAVATAELGLDGRFLEVNERLMQITGYSREELLRMTPGALKHPEERQREDRALSAYLAGHSPTYRAEKRYVRKDGAIVWVEISAAMVRDIAGKPLRSVAVIQDITARKRAEEALRQSEEEFRTFFNEVAIATAELGLDGRFFQVNERLTRLTGYSREELLHMTPAALVRPEDRQREDQALSAHLAGRSPTYRAEKCYVRKDGAIVWVEISAAMVRDIAGKPLRSVGVIQDITARKRAEEALRESEEKFSKAFAQNAAGMFISRLEDGRHLDVNRTWLEMFGFRREEVLGRTAQELNLWGTTEERERAVEGLRSTGRVRNREFRLRRRSGEMFVTLGSAEMLTMAGENVILGSCLDITERKRAEEALRESEQRFRLLSEHSPDCIALHDLQLRHLYVNPAIARLVGRPQEVFVGRSVGEMLAPPEAARQIERMLRQTLETDAAYQEEHALPTPGGPRHFLWRSVPLRDGDGKTRAILAISTDITERKKAEEALQCQAKHLEHLVQERTTALTERAQLLELSSDAIIVRDAQERITYWNRGAEQMYGWRREEACGKIIHELLQTRFPEPLEEILGKLRREGRWTGELVHTRRDGARLTVATRWALQQDAAGNTVAILASITDITERKLLERQILSAVDQERHRLGRELHDGLCQLLVGVKFKASLVESKLQRKTRVLPAEVNVLENELNQAIGQAQAMARGLNPVKMVGRGLAAALEELAVATQATFGLRCECTSAGPVALADAGMAQQLYRIAQEAVHNAVKHAQAQSIRIELKVVGEQFVLAVADDGMGFPGTVEDRAGMGLYNMRARAEQIGGRLQIQPGDQGGTVVTCTLRRPQEEPPEAWLAGGAR